MSVPVSFNDVQMLLGAHEARTAVRHTEILTRFDKLEVRVLAREIEAAENRPIIRGWKGASALLFASIMAGYIGSIFAN